MELREIASLFEVPFTEAKPVTLRGFHPEPEELFGEAHVLQMLRHPDVVRRAGIFWDQKHLGPDMDPSVITEEGIQRYRSTGKVSLSLYGAQRLPGQVRDICRKLNRLGLWKSVYAVGFETLEGKPALKIHWDINCVLAIQTQGRKRWDVFRPVVTSDEELHKFWCGTPEYEKMVEEITPADLFESVVLEPGDAIFVPAGWPHYPSSEEGTSLHVSIAPISEKVFAEREGNEDHLL